MNKTKNSLGTNQPNKPRRRLELLLIIAAILILTLTACAPALTPVPFGTFVPTTVVPTSTSTEIPVTATATLTVAQEPPPCTFPLAQINTAASTPANYTFSDPQIALTAPKGNIYHIIQWIPDNQQFLIAEDLFGSYVNRNDTVLPQSISLYNAVTGVSKVYATRPYNNEPPSWQPALNAVVYRASSYSSIDKVHGAYKFTDQLWASHGDPNAAQKLADNLSQFPFGVKPDGSEMIYRLDNKITGLDKSLKAIPSVSFDPTQWDYAKARRDSYPVSFQMAWQPGTSLIFLYSDGADQGGGYTFILNADTGQVCELNLGGWAEKVVHWSSDGRYLAFIRSVNYTFPTDSADLTVLDTVTGKLKVLSVIPQGTGGLHAAEDFAWAPDNRHLLATGEIYISPDIQAKVGLYLVDFVSGQSTNVTPTYQSYPNVPQSIAWSPDGSKVAVQCPAIGAIGIDHICLIPVQKTGQ